MQRERIFSPKNYFQKLSRQEKAKTEANFEDLSEIAFKTQPPSYYTANNKKRPKRQR